MTEWIPVKNYTITRASQPVRDAVITFNAVKFLHRQKCYTKLSND